MTSLNELPERHPFKRFFRNLTSRAMKQSSLPDKDLLAYLSEMLIHFVKIDHLYNSPDGRQRDLRYLVDMMAEINQISCSQKEIVVQTYCGLQSVHPGDVSGKSERAQECPSPLILRGYRTTLLPGGQPFGNRLLQHCGFQKTGQQI